MAIFLFFLLLFLGVPDGHAGECDEFFSAIPHDGQGKTKGMKFGYWGEHWGFSLLNSNVVIPKISAALKRRSKVHIKPGSKILHFENDGKMSQMNDSTLKYGGDYQPTIYVIEPAQGEKTKLEMYILHEGGGSLRTRHSSVSRKANFCAGDTFIRGGKIRYLDRMSGHYKISKERFLWCVEQLRNMGLLDEAYVVTELLSHSQKQSILKKIAAGQTTEEIQGSVKNAYFK